VTPAGAGVPGRSTRLVRTMAKATFAAADLMRGAWQGPRLLLYHRVTEGLSREMEIPFELFRRQLGWLEAHAEIISLEDAITEDLRNGPRSTCVLTFDDGYEDLYRLAYPLLAERRLPFVLYLTTEPVETGHSLGPGGEPLSWDQVRAMAEGGLMTLGAHTHRHPDLRALSRDELAEELDRSNDLIERRTGIRPRHFAYPKGFWDPRAEELVRARYESAVLGAGPPITLDSDRHRLSRIPVQRSDGFFFFRRKVERGMRLEERVRSRLKGYRHPPDW
jgi:peptidoglycan/xylan/chitin deacetylase (PgdA/CDA1 family)